MPQDQIVWARIIEQSIWETKTKNDLISSISEFLNGEQHLLEGDASERSICFRLGYHLQKQLEQNWTVDCGYNLHGLDPKVVDLLVTPDNSQVGLEQESAVFPDIIVHKRGDGGHNHIVFEVKKTTNPVSDERDLMKLKAYKNQLGYDYAIFMRIQTGKSGFNGIESLSIYRNRME